MMLMMLLPLASTTLGRYEIQPEIDIKSTFTHRAGIQALFICEFGQMCPTIDEVRGEAVTKECFVNMPLVFGQDYLNGLAMPPYIALVDPRYQKVDSDECIKRGNLFDKSRYFVMKIMVRRGGKLAADSNGHVHTK